MFLPFIQLSWFCVEYFQKSQKIFLIGFVSQLRLSACLFVLCVLYSQQPFVLVLVSSVGHWVLFSNSYFSSRYKYLFSTHFCGPSFYLMPFLVVVYNNMLNCYFTSHYKVFHNQPLTLWSPFSFSAFYSCVWYKVILVNSKL